MLSILDDSLRRLEAAGLTRDRRVIEIVPTASYLAVVLDNGSHGWALCYANLSPEERRALADPSDLDGDPLLNKMLSSVFRSELVASALRAALVSALSVPVWRNPAYFGLSATDDLPRDALAAAETAVVVGFGGLMFDFFALPSLRCLHVMDLSYGSRSQEINSVVDALAIARPDVTIRVSDGGGTWPTKGVDLVSITASALCNGTMETLLQRLGGSETVFVQGQSGAIYPEALFCRGVSAVVSSVKPAKMLAAARRDPSGAELIRWVEGRANRRILMSRSFPTCSP